MSDEQFAKLFKYLDDRFKAVDGQFELVRGSFSDIRSAIDHYFVQAKSCALSKSSESINGHEDSRALPQRPTRSRR